MTPSYVLFSLRLFPLFDAPTSSSIQTTTHLKKQSLLFSRTSPRRITFPQRSYNISLHICKERLRSLLRDASIATWFAGALALQTLRSRNSVLENAGESILIILLNLSKLTVMNNWVNSWNSILFALLRLVYYMQSWKGESTLSKLAQLQKYQ